jgi:hypothetical protein
MPRNCGSFSGARLLRTALALALALLLSGCAGRYFHAAGDAPPPPRFTLDTLPQQELWAGVIFNGNKVGFSRLKLEKLGEGRYRLESETSIRLRILGFDKKIVLRSTDVVREDLSLVSFRYDHVIDGSELKLEGQVGDRDLRVDVRTGATASVQVLPVEGRIHPSSALTLYPVIAGLAIGREFRLNVYNGEVQRIAESVQRVEGWERSPLFEGAAFKVGTSMLGMSTTTWIDLKGRPLFELGLNGVLVSALEDERTARGYLAAAALNQDDALVQWTLVKSPPIAEARTLKRLSVALSGGGKRQPLSDSRQRCKPSEKEWLCEIDSSGGDLAAVDKKYLRSSFSVLPGDLAISRLAREIAPESLPPAAKIQALLDWMGANIRKEAADSYTARDVLDQRRGECQGHSYLYASFARSLGIPTRIMNGLVYSPEHGGFLYHAWAESLVDGRWRAVDPTFGQAEADATHIALIEGEETADLLPLTDWVGSARIRVLNHSTFN